MKMRINIVEPKYLADQHLLAEYNELNMVAQSFRRSVLFKTGIDNLPKRYTLNSGHVKFFYDKGEYRYRRFYSLKKELKNRGFNVTQVFKNYWLFRTELFKDWTPEPDDYKIIFERINQKILQKPSWYRYHRKPIDENYIDNLKQYIECVE